MIHELFSAEAGGGESRSSGGNTSMKALIERMRQQLDQWHDQHLDFFPLETYEWDVDPDSLEGQAFRLIYNNHQNWHTEELVQSLEDSQAIIRYRAGMKFNRDRNAAMEKLDQILCQWQKGTGEWHSETLSSILDRITILHLKRLHAQDEAPEKVPSLQAQADFLANYAVRLFEDMLMGRRRCIQFTRLKLFNTWAHDDSPDYREGAPPDDPPSSAV
jgi:hypothetical protein